VDELVHVAHPAFFLSLGPSTQPMRYIRYDIFIFQRRKLGHVDIKELAKSPAAKTPKPQP
jgi:hypothetical protein